MRVSEVVNSVAETYLGFPWSWSVSEEVEEGERYWVATIGELPDFFAAGRTKAEAVANARDALLSHLTAYVSEGMDVPHPRATSRARAVAAGNSVNYAFA